MRRGEREEMWEFGVEGEGEGEGGGGGGGGGRRSLGSWASHLAKCVLSL